MKKQTTQPYVQYSSHVYLYLSLCISVYTDAYSMCVYIYIYVYIHRYVTGRAFTLRKMLIITYLKGKITVT